MQVWRLLTFDLPEFQVENGAASEKSAPADNSKDSSAATAADPPECENPAGGSGGGGEAVSPGKEEAAPAVSVATPIAEGTQGSIYLPVFSVFIQCCYWLV